MASQASSPLKRHVQLIDSFHRSLEEGLALSGAPSPFQEPTNSLNACSASLAFLGSSLSLSAATTRAAMPSRLSRAAKPNSLFMGAGPQKAAERSTSSLAG